MKIGFLGSLTSALLITGIATAKVAPGINSMFSCQSAHLQGEPLSEVKYFATDKFEKYLSSQEMRKLFDPQSVAKDLESTGIVRSTVSSSHIMQILADGLKQIDRQTTQLVKEGKLVPLIDGQAYSYDEYQRRLKSENDARKKYFEPALAQMYRIYIEALKNKKARAAQIQMTQAAQAFMKQIQAQRDALSKTINESIPSLKTKIGEIENVTSTDLPVSYHDGAIAKIRFQRAGQPHSMTVYPTMLLNQLVGEDEFFLKAMERWVSYTQGQWEVANSIVNSSGLTYLYYYARVTLSNLIGNSSNGPQQLKNLAPYMKEAYEKAKADLESARWTHNEASKLAPSEILSLLDLFRALRFGDIPQCQDQIKQLNTKMASFLPKVKCEPNESPINCSTASPKMSPEKKKAADDFAKVIAFYQDQYKVYSTAAALVRVNGRR